MNVSHDHVPGSAGSARGVRLRRLFGRDAVLGYALLIPLLVFALGLLAYPFASALLLSLQEKSVGQAPTFVGFANYIHLFTVDPVFPLAVRNTLIYTLGCVTIRLILGMGMALTLNEQFKMRGFARGLMLMPWVMPDLVVALTWRWMFDGTFGIFNHMLKATGLIEASMPWLSRPATGLGAAIIANSWRGFPFFGITLLAALQAIPAELYEVAEIDGASVVQRFLHITLPGIQPVLLVATILSTIWVFNDFVMVWTMTGGGPLDRTHVFATYAYQLGFKYNQLGMAVAATVTMFPLLIGLILVLAPRMWQEE